MKNIALVFAALTINSVCFGAITWGTPRNIVNDSDVSLDGQLVHAYTFTTTNPGNTHVINSVGFVRTQTLEVSGSYHWGPSGPSQASEFANVGNASAAPYSTTTADYRAILAMGLLATGGSVGATPNANDAFYNAYTLTLQGLSVGSTYQVQMWFSDSRNFSSAFEAVGHLTDGAHDAPPTGPLVDYNVGNVEAGGGLGQHVTGTFVATGTTESITFTTRGSSVNNTALLNAYQLRAIPEPASALIGVLGLARLFLRRR
jgi:hypothetical protein